MYSVTSWRTKRKHGAVSKAARLSGEPVMKLSMPTTSQPRDGAVLPLGPPGRDRVHRGRGADRVKSEEHTSELQSQSNLVCRLLLEKKKHTVLTRNMSA